MTRSKLRKIRRNQAKKTRVFLTGVPLASAMLVGAPVVQAQQAEEQSGGLDEVVVTALKTQQNLQDVPVSIQAISTERLEELNISSFDDYVKYLPSVSYQSAGPGFARVFMRGAASGDNGNHSGPQPSVGVYLDEQPVTTIQGALDIHMYDINRVEALSGPQGTLYGASSEAGTVRIITNKPDPSAFAAGFGVEVNSVSHGGIGHVLEGFINAPLSPSAALRAVAWQKRDAGYIDNKLGTRTYPTWDDATGGHGTIDNATLAKDNYNDANSIGGRVLFRWDINENWSITPGIMGQSTDTDGQFFYDPVVGDLALTHFRPELSTDKWNQASL